MKIIPGSSRYHYLAGVSIFLVAVALIAGMAGCDSQSLEIRTWYDLDAVRDNLSGNHTLMNDLDSTTAGYEELASPTANQGKGWQPIGDSQDPFRGTLDGQGYRIVGLYINRPLESSVGLLGFVAEEAEIRNIRVEGADISGDLSTVGGLAGSNYGEVINCCSTGSVRGVCYFGGLIGTNRGTVSRSYSAGNVTEREIVNGASTLSMPPGYAIGGLIGWNNGVVSDSYSVAHVSWDSSSLCGLIGANLHLSTILNTYAAGNVSGYDDDCGLCTRSATVSNSFWDVETTGSTESPAGTGKTTAEMMDIATFTDTATEGLDEPWDIIAVAPGSTNTTYIWNIVDDETYPFLSWEL